MGKGYVRESHESIPGNELNAPTLATKKIFPRQTSFEGTFGGAPMLRDDELLNTDEPVEAIEDEYNPSWSSAGRMYPDEIGYYLTEMLGLPVTTAGNGVITDPDTNTIPTGAHRHVWTSPFGPAGASPKTFQADIAYSDPEAIFLKAKGCAVGQLEISQGSGVQVRRSGPALYLDEQGDPSLTPVVESDAISPFHRAFASLTWLTGTAAARDFALTVQQALSPEHGYGSGSRWPDLMFKGDEPIMIFGSIPKQLFDIDDFRALRDVTKFAAKAKFQSPTIIASGYPYRLWFDMPNCQYTDGNPEPLDNRRRRGANYNWKAVRSGASAACTITLVNGTTNYV